MHSTRTRVHARIPKGLPREEKRVSDKSPLTKVGEDRRAQLACRARRDRPRHFRARILARKLARKSVSGSVWVSVQWNFGYTQL